VGVLRGLGNGQFGAPLPYGNATTYYTAVATADFNGDGKLDAVATDSGADVWLGNGDGTMRDPVPFATGTAPASVAVGDFNRDGRPDVATANAGSNNVSVLLNVVDTVSPTAGAAQFPYLLAPHRITIPFSEPVGPSLSLADITVQDLTTAMTANPVSFSYDTGANVATFSFAGVLPDGNYRAMIPAANVTDLAGNPLSGDVSFDFFVLAGDADRDQVVDIDDLGILATNWQGTGKTFSQGDFNYDHVVDITDLGILATNWQKSLPLPSALESSAAARRHSASRVIDGLV
jgi:hypothetical protein